MLLVTDKPKYLSDLEPQLHQTMACQEPHTNFFYLLPELSTFVRVCLIDGAARIFSYLPWCNWYSNLSQFSCTLKDLNSGQFAKLSFHRY